jgi:peptide/nickel transport system permease protein
MGAPNDPGTPGTAGPRSLRERLDRHPLGPGLWTGLILLAGYIGVALSAIVVFGTSVGRISSRPAWVSGFPVYGPTWAHPFGILPGFGTDLFQAIWKATPWDLGIVFGILAIDALLGWGLGSLAGMYEGGALDAIVVFVGDSVGAIPSFFLVIAVFAGLTTVAPGQVNLPVFVVLFGALLWPATARTTRERARSVAKQPFLEAARASGASPRYLYFRHVLPNSVAPLLAQLPIDVAPIFFVLAVFPWFWYCAGPYHPPPSPLPPPPYLVPTLTPYSPLPSVYTPEWGNLLAAGTCEGLGTIGLNHGFGYWWMYIFPMIAIVMLGVAIALVCDGVDRYLREAHD